jgi:predicted ATPase
MRRNDFSNVTAFPALVLKQDNWNDYGYVATYEVYYFSNHASINDPEYFGNVKILMLSNDENVYATKTQIPQYSMALGENFGSFGQGIGYYKAILEKGDNFVGDYAYSMSDVLLRAKAQPPLSEFPLDMNHDAINKCLTRDSESLKRLLNDRGRGLSAYIGGLKFKFTTKLPYSTEPHDISLEFPSSSILSSRMNILIGKNGTGKTQFLCEFIKKIIGQSEEGILEPESIIFDSVIAVSYSIFDNYPIISEGEHFSENIGSYHYCGFRNGNSETCLEDRFTKSILKIAVYNPDREQFVTFMKQVFTTLGEQYNQEVYIQRRSSNTEDKTPAIPVDYFYHWMCDTFKTLSSGGKIITLILAEIYERIIDHSIIILDEPETHLHPGLLSSFLSFLQQLLEKKSSYAIIATHSPIVLQSIPRYFVNVIERFGNSPKISRLSEECFGESLGKIFLSVLSLDSTERDYHKILNDTLQHHSTKEVIDYFNGNIGMGAHMHLLSKSSREGESS